MKDHERVLDLPSAQLALVDAAYPNKVVPTGRQRWRIGDDGEPERVTADMLTIDGPRWKSVRILVRFGLMEAVQSNRVIIGYRLTARGRRDHRARLRQSGPVVEREHRVSVSLPSPHLALLGRLAQDGIANVSRVDDVVREALELYATRHGRAADVNHIHRFIRKD